MKFFFLFVLHKHKYPPFLSFLSLFFLFFDLTKTHIYKHIIIFFLVHFRLLLLLYYSLHMSYYKINVLPDFFFLFLINFILFFVVVLKSFDYLYSTYYIFIWFNIINCHLI
eukprot:UN01300